MNLHLAPSRVVLSAGALLLLAAQPLLAQPAAVQTVDSANTVQQLQKPLAPASASENNVPLLYEGEMEDLGPQYVLQPKPKPKYFQAGFDVQTYRTNNATLAPGNKVASDITALTLQLAIQTEEEEILTAKVQAHAGFRYQSFYYGLLYGREQIITGAPVKDNDFETYSPYISVNFIKDSWYGSATLTYSDFKNQTSTTSGTFYQEWVPSWTLGHQWNLSPQKTFQIEYDGDYRATNTVSGGLQPDGFNDRTDNSVSLIYSYIIGQHLVLQPSYRFMYSDYTNEARHRSDVYNTFSFVAAYYFNDVFSARAFTSYEWRSSSEPGNNYENWNIGLGITFSMQF